MGEKRVSSTQKVGKRTGRVHLVHFVPAFVWGKCISWPGVDACGYGGVSMDAYTGEIDSGERFKTSPYSAPDQMPREAITVSCF